MTDDSELAHLFDAYLNQDVFDLYEDEFEAVDDFAAKEPESAARVPSQIARILDQVEGEAALEDHLDNMGVEVRPVELTYREWLTRIADRVRAAIT